MRVEHVALIHCLDDGSFRLSFPHMPHMPHMPPNMQQCTVTADTPQGAIRKGRTALRDFLDAWLDACARQDSALPAQGIFGPAQGAFGLAQSTFGGPDIGAATGPHRGRDTGDLFAMVFIVVEYGAVECGPVENGPDGENAARPERGEGRRFGQTAL